MRSEKNPIILVANKADTVRNRKVKSSLGKELATVNNIKYIETSSGKFSTFWNCYKNSISKSLFLNIKTLKHVSNRSIKKDITMPCEKIWSTTFSTKMLDSDNHH